MVDSEVRLALVMNGGVSLAVWIAGVTHEIDLIRRATLDGTALQTKEYDEPVAARWHDLLLPEDGDRRRVVVDVMAGTSAGGLNATMLATAIAHDGTLDPAFTADDLGPSARLDGPWLREVWCSLAALRGGKLLPAKAETTTGSVLDGGFFHDQLKSVMAKLGQGTTSSPHPVTLFTTASGMGRQSYAATDAAGQAFEVADHRFVYRFTTNKPWDYDPHTLRFTSPVDPGADFDDPDRLALAARASASFPVAFQPVRESDTMNQAPPKERPAVVGDHTSWLIDGGVLDNAPFGPVLDTVAKGTLSGKVDRYVVYVVPSAGIGTAATAVDPAEPNAPKWMSTIGSAFQYPREVDFRSDVEDLARLRVEADTAWSDAQDLYEKAVADDTEFHNLHAAAQLLQPTYTRGRAAGAVWQAILIGESGRVTLLDDDAASPMRKADHILARPRRFTPPAGFRLHALVEAPGGPLWPWGLEPAERVARTILRSTRRHLDTALGDEDADTRLGPDALGDRLERISTTRTQIFSLEGKVQAAIRERYATLATGTGRRGPGVLAVADAIDDVFTDLRVQEVLGREIAALQDDLGEDGHRLVEAALAVEVASRCTSSRTPDQRSVPFEFVRLGPDVGLPVLDEPGQELVRDLGSRILYGTRVAHFGAFGADDWRRWDWLMGRLHAVAHLGMLLHDTSTPEKEEQARTWVATTQQAVLEAEGSSTAEVVARLGTLQRDYPVDSIRYGAARLIEAMNDSDRDLPDDQVATLQIGERLVAVSSGLGTQPARWVRAVAGLATPDDIRPMERVGRWFATPMRAALWRRVTGGRVPAAERRRWTRFLSWTPWVLAAVGVALVVVGAVLVGDSPAAGLVCACLGAVIALMGGAVGVVLAKVRGMRRRMKSSFGGLLETWLPAGQGSDVPPAHVPSQPGGPPDSAVRRPERTG